MLKELEKDYLQGNLKRLEYMKALNKEHQKLYKYSNFIKNTKCKEIIINQNDVIYKFIDDDNEEFCLSCNKDDNTSIAFTHLGIGYYDLVETKFINTLIKEKDVIFDIGANTGWYTLNFLKYGVDINLFSFEPLSDNFKYLYQNIKQNTYNYLNSYHLVNIGLSDKKEFKDFYFDTERYGASSAKQIQENVKYKKIWLEFNTIDSYIKENNINRLNLIKLDVEGSELLVIKGGIKSIEKYKPIIYCELLRKWSAKFNYNPNDVIKILKDIGYKCNVLKDNLKLEEITEINDQTLDTNFIFIYEGEK